MKFDGLLALSLFLTCLAVPAPMLRQLLLPMNTYLLIQFVLGLFVSIGSIRVNTAATVVFTLGLTVNFLTALHDIALGSGLTWTTGYFLSPIGVSVLIFSQGQILSINFDRAYSLAARLSKDLQTEVDRQTAEVKTIMNTIPQGIMTINETGTIEFDVSTQVGTILQRDHIGGELWSSILLGLITEQDAADMQKVVDLIFHPNLSTAKQLTQFSGRGVGMNAVRSYLEDIGAHVDAKIANMIPGKARQPFYLQILIPKGHAFAVPAVQNTPKEKFLATV
jgi:hypothetical protein